MCVLGAPVVGMRLCIFCEPSFASHTYYKTGSGQKYRNKAARVGTLALFQDQVTLMVRLQLALCPDPLTWRLQCCLPVMSASQSHWINNHNAQYKSKGKAHDSESQSHNYWKHTTHQVSENYDTAPVIVYFASTSIFISLLSHMPLLLLWTLVTIIYLHFSTHFICELITQHQCFSYRLLVSVPDPNQP